MRSAFKFPEPELLELELTARKWTRQDLAAAAGISRPAAGRCVNGGRVKPETTWKVIRTLERVPPLPEMAAWLAASRAAALARAS